MNRDRAIWELDELADHLKDVVEDIQSGRYDESGDLSYAGGLQHLMDHLARAWHFAHMTDEQIDALTQEQFEEVTHAIPKLWVDQRLVEMWEKVV
jgi:hypothetical protein